jgi:hypothetical protein
MFQRHFKRSSLVATSAKAVRKTPLCMGVGAGQPWMHVHGCIAAGHLCLETSAESLLDPTSNECRVLFVALQDQDRVRLAVLAAVAVFMIVGSINLWQLVDPQTLW